MAHLVCIICPIFKESENSDTFQFGHFLILTLSNSDTFQFLPNWAKIGFRHFPIPRKAMSKSWSLLIVVP